VAAELTMEIAAMPVGPIHHRRNDESSSFLFQTVTITHLQGMGRGKRLLLAVICPFIQFPDCVIRAIVVVIWLEGNAWRGLLRRLF
jgi:hypothetical protein